MATKKTFKIGDRVVYNGDETSLVGKHGTVFALYETNIFGIEFDENVHKHSLGGTSSPECKEGHGWWATARELTLESKEVEKEEKSATMKYIEKKWGKIGELLFRAIDIIKKLLALLLSSKVTKEQKAEVEKIVKVFFSDVKQQLTDELKEEEKKSKGEEGDAQEKKPSGQGGGDSVDGEGDEGQGGVDNGGSVNEDSKGDIDSHVENQDSETGQESLKKIQLAMAKVGSVQGGGKTAPQAPPGKVFCGVCNKYHTKGTHD